MPARPDVISEWHEVVTSGDTGRLADLLAEDVTFRSPAQFRPVEGKEGTLRYLHAAFAVLGPSLEYQHEWYADRSAVLEFTALLDGDTRTHGIDMLTWGEDGLITEVSVMVRPFSAINQLIGLMGGRLKEQERAARRTG